MVFSSTTFLFLFLPAIIFFYWLPDVFLKIKSFFCNNYTPNLSHQIKEDASPQSGVAAEQLPQRMAVCKLATGGQRVASEAEGAAVRDSGIRKYKNLVLLAFSILFYAWGEPAFVLVMLLSIFVNYLLGRLIDKYRNHDKALLWTSVIFNLGILFIFKYLCFTLQNIGWLISKDFSSIKIALPIGISFFTFQAMSYVIDVYEKKVEVQKSLFNLGLYIALFPQLIAGPIVRYETIEKEIENRYENYDDFAEGTVRFIQGLAKKVIIANQVALVADAAFETPTNELSTSFTWLGAIAYTLQIYFDFSGYSDMAIGLGRLFGFHFLENFNYPYMASSITDFWRRWHISLSSWFRDYVYFPLGGSRVDSKARHIFNLFVVWLLTGIWHGANWTFIAWGLFYFILLVIEKQTGLDKKKAWWGHIYTMFFVVLAWVLFRATNINSAYEYLKIMLVPNSNSTDTFELYWSNYWFYLILGFILCFRWNKFIPSFCEVNPKFWGSVHLKGDVSEADRGDLNENKNPSTTLSNNQNNHNPHQSYLFIKDFLEVIQFAVLFFLVICYVIRGGYNPFIYFNF